MEKIPNTTVNFEQLPYSIRLCFQLLLIVLIAFIIVQFKTVLVPLYFSVLISILLLPVNIFLEKKRFPRVLASLFPVVVALFIIIIVVYLLSSQIVGFLNDIPSIKTHLSEHYISLQRWVEDRFSISKGQQTAIVTNATAGMQDTGISYAKQTFVSITETLAFIIFTLIYSFLIIYYRQIIKKFLFAIFSKPHKGNIDAVISGSQQVVRSYMMGLVIEMAIVSTLNTLVLMIIGVKYAIFLGVLTGVLNIMPFIGIYSGILFTALITLTTAASMGQIGWIFIGLLGVHFVDSNFLMPRIVGSKVKINALIAMLGAIAGGVLLGIPGVFFALPTIAILKIIFDRIDSMKPWGMLLGEETQEPKRRNRLKKNIKAQ